MREMTSAQFMDQVWKLTEPVTVLRYKDVKGTWYPAGTEPKMETVATTETLSPLIRQDLPHINFGKSRAAPKPGSKK